MIRYFIFLLFFLSPVLVGMDSAEAKVTTSRAFKSGNWVGTNFYTNGRFTHCQMAANYRNGSKLIFGLEPNKAMSVGVINKRWNLIRGRKENVRLLVDGRTALWTTAKVLRPHHIAAFFRTDSGTYNMLRRGRNLAIEAGGTRLSYSLRGTSRALIRLLRCTIAGIRSNRYLANTAPPRNSGNGIFTPAPAPVARPAPPRMAARPATPPPANPFAAPAPAPRKASKSRRRTPFSHGLWRGGSYLSKRTGRFSHCAMSVGYKSGSRLVIGILRDKTMTIGVTHPKWVMKVGDQLPLDFAVDGRHAVRAKAKVINTKQYAAYFRSDAQVFEMIRTGKVLKISSSGATQKFELSGIDQSLAKLLTCTVNALDAEKASSAPPPNPFSAPPASTAPPPANPFSAPPASRPAAPLPPRGRERDA